MIDYDGLSPKARVEKFDITHGLNAVRLGGCLLFADGAIRDLNPLGPLDEPPADLYQRAKLILKYPSAAEPQPKRYCLGLE